MADKYVNELPQETYNTLDGTEQFVMFDVAEGKRSTLNTIGNYVLSKMTPDNLDKSVTGTISDMQTDIDTLQLAVGSPLVAETVSNMTDTTKIYVYVGNETGYTAGNWYYWNGTGWVSGGVYNAEAVATDTTLAVSGAPADSKATGDALDTKVDKVTGKGLSTEDYTTEEKTKLSGIATGATNVVIDNTLTTTGQAADAKKTGDEISDLKEDLNIIRSTRGNRIPVEDSLSLGSINASGVVPNDYRFHTDDYYLIDEKLSIKFYSSLLKVEIEYYNASKEYIGNSGYKTSDYTYDPVGSNVAFVRFLFAGQAGNIDFNTNGIPFNIGISFEYDNISTQILKTRIDGLENTDGNNPTKLRVASWNVGHYNNGNWNVNWADADVIARTPHYRKLFADLNCDVLGLQEHNWFLDRDSLQIGTDVYLYDGTYKYHNNIHNVSDSYYASTCLKSRYELFDKRESVIDNDREAHTGIIKIDKKDIFLCSAHLSTDATTRATNIQTILGLIANKDYVILFMDTNTNPTGLIAFSEAGYKILNGGWFGNIETIDGTIGDLCIDNIIVTQNIYPTNLYVQDFNNEYIKSDHYPIVADLLIY